jgi:hypothetical protein
MLTPIYSAATSMRVQINHKASASISVGPDDVKLWRRSKSKTLRIPIGLCRRRVDGRLRGMQSVSRTLFGKKGQAVQMVPRALFHASEQHKGLPAFLRRHRARTFQPAVPSSTAHIGPNVLA